MCILSVGVYVSKVTLPETNSSPMKIAMFPCKYHQNGGFSMAMLVSGRVLNRILGYTPWNEQQKSLRFFFGVDVSFREADI